LVFVEFAVKYKLLSAREGAVAAPPFTRFTEDKIVATVKLCRKPDKKRNVTRQTAVFLEAEMLKIDWINRWSQQAVWLTVAAGLVA